MSKSRARRVSKRTWRQFVLYNLGGLAYFWSGYVWFFVADQGLHWTLWWAKLSANLLGVSVNFLIQHFMAFESHKHDESVSRITGRYAVITGVDWVIDYFIVRQLKIWGITPYIGQFISASLFVGWNWYWYKYWVFAERPKRIKGRRVAPRPA